MKIKLTRTHVWMVAAVCGWLVAAYSLWDDYSFRERVITQLQYQWRHP